MIPVQPNKKEDRLNKEAVHSSLAVHVELVERYILADVLWSHETRDLGMPLVILARWRTTFTTTSELVGCLLSELLYDFGEALQVPCLPFRPTLCLLQIVFETDRNMRCPEMRDEPCVDNQVRGLLDKVAGDDLRIAASHLVNFSQPSLVVVAHCVLADGRVAFGFRRKLISRLTPRLLRVRQLLQLLGSEPTISREDDLQIGL